MFQELKEGLCGWSTGTEGRGVGDELGEVGWGQIMLGPVRHGEDGLFYSKKNRRSFQGFERGSDRDSFTFLKDLSSCCVPVG